MYKKEQLLDNNTFSKPMMTRDEGSKLHDSGSVGSSKCEDTAAMVD